MAKGKAKINRSEVQKEEVEKFRKRKCPSDDISPDDDVQALHQQDTDENNRAVAVESLLSPLQECAVITNEQVQMAEQSCLTEQDDSSNEKPAEATNDATHVPLTNVAVTDQEEKLVTMSEGFQVHVDNNTSKSGMELEEVASEENNSSASEACEDKLQVSLPVAEEGDGSCAAALVKQRGARENFNSEGIQETSQAEPSTKETAKESAVELPAKKKRRMGMCGLTEKERSHFLQTQKRKNGTNGMESTDKPICNNTVDPVAMEEATSSPPSTPADITEQSKAELKLQSSLCGGNDRAETEVHIVVTASDGTSFVCDPASSEEKSFEAEGDVVPAPEQTSNPKTGQLIEEEECGHLGNQKLQELSGQTAELMTEKPEIQGKKGEDGSAEVDSAITFPTSRNEESDTQDEVEAEPLQVNSVARTEEETNKEMPADVVSGDGVEAAASTTDIQSGGLNCGSGELCEAAVTPSVSKRNVRCDSGGEPAVGPSTVNAEHIQTTEATDPFGSGCTDYVSDSQLNTIVLIEEAVMKREEPASSDHREDATSLICGLIRELSSLNRKVMATHREMENLRRGTKSSRNSKR